MGIDLESTSNGKNMSRYIGSLTIIIFITITGCYIILFGFTFNITKEDKKTIDLAVYKFSKSVFDTSLLFVITHSENAYSFLVRKIKLMVRSEGSITVII